jgi:hypothetical protein
MQRNEHTKEAARGGHAFDDDGELTMKKYNQPKTPLWRRQRGGCSAMITFRKPGGGHETFRKPGGSMTTTMTKKINNQPTIICQGDAAGTEEASGLGGEGE